MQTVWDRIETIQIMDVVVYLGCYTEKEEAKDEEEQEQEEEEQAEQEEQEEQEEDSSTMCGT